jgi:AcrR family transcriptional regulator
MPRKPKVIEDRREQILDAAMRVFAQKGFLRATNKDIAREAGITPGLIYHYFDNKEAVLMGVIESRSPLYIVRTLPAQALEQPPAMLLRFLLTRALEAVESEQFVRLIRVFLPEVIYNPELAPLGVRVIQQVIHFLDSYLAACIERGDLRRTNTALVAQTLIGSIMGFLLRRQILRDPEALQYSHEQFVETLLDTVLHGLLPA